MPGGGSKPGERRGGRRKGTPNKVTAKAKDAIALAAAGLGGAKRLQEWAQEDPANERAFWTQIYTKLVPHEVTGEDGKALLPTVVKHVIQPDDGK